MERAIELVGPHDSPVLLVGEPGSGRSRLARQLHLASPRKTAPVVQLDCRGLSVVSEGVQLLESAHHRAAAGSLLLENIELLNATLQVKLMVLLETPRRSRRPRILSTAQRDLEDEVRRGTFREDLRTRVNVLELRVPPLRERRSDIPQLARELANESAARFGVAPPLVTPDVEALLVAYAWPGNVRELRNAMERAVALSAGGMIELSALPPRVLAVSDKVAP